MLPLGDFLRQLRRFGSGNFRRNSVNYYGYFEQVCNATVLANVQSVYLVNAADPCFQAPGTTCTTATVIQVPIV